MKRTAVVALAIALVALNRSADAQPYKGCVVFEDDSFICGTLLQEPGSYEAIDFTLPYVEGCIPRGLCDS